MGCQSLNLNSHRKGFSLVELLVAMAIIIFMLTIMSQAFVIATTCMQGLKGVGELLDKGRPVLAVLQKDLSAYHFDGMRRLSDEDFWSNGPPSQGYFHMYQGGLSTVEGVTNDGVGYEISGTTSDHRLAFTSRLSGKNPEDFYIAPLENYSMVPPNPPMVPTDYANLVSLFNTGTTLSKSDNSSRFDFNLGVVHSQWAEIAYFTKPNNRNANGVPLMDLYRQQKLVLPSTFEANNLQIDSAKYLAYYENFSCKSATVANNMPPPPTKQIVYFNSPSDLSVAANRVPIDVANFPVNTLYPNSDVLLNDIISFDVRILPDSSLLDFSLLSNLITLRPFAPNSSGYNNISNTKVPCVFDTWCTDRSGAVKYDIGDFSSGVWQPNSADPAKVPVWNYFYYVDPMNPMNSAYIPIKGLRINAIQVSIRVWDEKSQKAREFKLIQRL